MPHEVPSLTLPAAVQTGEPVMHAIVAFWHEPASVQSVSYDIDKCCRRLAIGVSGQPFLGCAAGARNSGWNQSDYVVRQENK